MKVNSQPISPSAREGAGLAKIASESAAAAANLPNPCIASSTSIRLAANALEEGADGDFATKAAHGTKQHSNSVKVFILIVL